MSVTNQQLMDKLEDVSIKVHDIREALYDPDEGIYKRIGDNANAIEDLTEDFEEHKENQKRTVWWFAGLVGGTIVAFLKSVFTGK